MKRTVVISFDVEPDYPPYLGVSHMGINEGLPALLDLLKSENVPANVFFLAELCDDYPSLPKDVVRQGFHLRNHSVTHDLLCVESFEKQLQLVRSSTESLNEASGVRTTTFRAPNFSFNETTLRVLEKTGYLIDSSVLPERREKKGLHGYAFDFRGATRIPYHPSTDDVRKPGGSPVLEIPSTENPIVRAIPIGGGFLNTYGAAKGFEAASRAQGDAVVMVFHPWEFANIYEKHPNLPRWIRAACRKDLSALSEFLGMAKSDGWKFVTLEDVAETYRATHPEPYPGDVVSKGPELHIPSPRGGAIERGEKEGGKVESRLDARTPIPIPRPKILLTWPYFYPEINAAATRGAAFAKYFRMAGADVEVLAPMRPNLPEDIVVEGVRIRRLTTYETMRLKHGTLYSRVFMPRSVSQIRKIIGQSPPSIMMTSSPSPFFAYEIVRANRRLRLPVIFDVGDVWPYDVVAGGGWLRNAIKKRVEGVCARSAAKIFVVTESMKKPLVDDHGVSERDIAVVPNGADLEFFKNLSPEKSWDIMILGSAAIYRNLEQVFEAFSYVLKKRPETRMLYLGWRRDEYTIGLEKLAECLGLMPALLLKPPVPFQQVPAILSSGRIGIVSQIWDAPIRASIAVKAYEYMAAGLPIACLGPPEDCEMRRLVTNTGAGIYESSPSALADGICELLADDAKLSRYAASSRNAANQFDRGIIARKAYGEYLLPLMGGH